MSPLVSRDYLSSTKRESSSQTRKSWWLWILQNWIKTSNPALTKKRSFLGKKRQERQVSLPSTPFTIIRELLCQLPLSSHFISPCFVTPHVVCMSICFVSLLCELSHWSFSLKHTKISWQLKDRRKSHAPSTISSFDSQLPVVALGLSSLPPRNTFFGVKTQWCENWGKLIETSQLTQLNNSIISRKKNGSSLKRSHFLISSSTPKTSTLSTSQPPKHAFQRDAKAHFIL